jgi:ABC-type methionine transport system permease subunit
VKLYIAVAIIILIVQLVQWAGRALENSLRRDLPVASL